MLFGRRENTANRPWRLSAKLLIASSVVTVIGFSAICASVMLDMRHGEEELARQTRTTLHPVSTPTSAATSSFTTCRCVPSSAPC
jgi:hypothetical protein